MKIFSFLILFLSPLFAQYTSSDYELVKTTFTKEFNPETINNYLSSAEDQKIIAGLLSLTHAKDFTYLDKILTLDFEKFGKYISFAVGHMGYSEKGLDFLREKIYDPDLNIFLPDLLEAYGLIGTEEDVNLLISYIEKGEKYPTGFSSAFYNFNQRGMITDYSALPDIFFLDLSYESEEENFNGLFGLARVAIDNQNAELLAEHIIEFKDSYSLRNLCYAFAALRRADSLYMNFSNLSSFYTHPDWRVRVEAVRTSAGYNFSAENEMSRFLANLSDINPNVGRQTAISLRQLQVNDQVRIFLKGWLLNEVDNKSLSNNVQGELFISLASLFPEINKDLLEYYSDKIDHKYLLSVLELKNTDKEFALNFLNGFAGKAAGPDRMNYLSALLAWQSELLNNKEYNDLALSFLGDKDPTLVSFICFAMDSLFIHKNKNMVEKGIKKQVREELNNPEFSEALTSLYNLAGRVDESLQDFMLDQFKESEVDDITRFYLAAEGEIMIPRSDLMFSKLWEYSFLYNMAKVYTTRGNFTLKLRPDLAPISVGNFLFLSDKGYYDNVVFHRVVPNFVAQIGDPTGTGWGGPGYTINAEFTPTPIAERFVGMASAGPDTEGSQWYILHNDFPHLYGRYTMFAEVIEGMDVVNSVDQSSRINNIELR